MTSSAKGAGAKKAAARGPSAAAGGKSAGGASAKSARAKTAARSAAAGAHGRATGARAAGKSTRPDDAPARRPQRAASASSKRPAKAAKVAKNAPAASRAVRSDRQRHGELAPSADRSTSATRRTGLGLPATREPESMPTPDTNTPDTNPIGLPATRSGDLPAGDLQPEADGGGSAGMSQPSGVGAALDADHPADPACQSTESPLGHDATGRGTDLEGL
jgi:hypothetical protein